MSRIYLNGKDWKVKEFIGLDWIWRDSVEPETKDARWWYPASVPGSVLHDMWMAGKIPDPFFEMNSRLSEWTSSRTWVYRKKFMAPGTVSGKHIELCFDGVDYECEVFLNGKSLARHSGMFVPLRLDVSREILPGEENLLAVVIEPAPSEQPQVGKTSLVHTHKSRMTYWWDFCPRMVHQGIWRDVYLEITETVRFEDYRIHTEFICGAAESGESGFREKSAEVRIQIQTAGAAEALLKGRFGEIPFSGRIENGYAEAVICVDRPRLWWTNGAGEPYEYDVSLELYSTDGGKELLSDRRHIKYGLRQIEFLQNEGTDDPAGCFTLCINGRRLYIKGCNWVPADVMYGAVRKGKLRHLIRLAKEAGVNMFRVWGGGLIETDLFYRICAENGILIWQEFIQSSSGIENKTPENDEYCRMMQEQAETIIKLKRNHTALAIWCGGNELQDAKGTPLDQTDKLLHLLQEQVKTWDPGRKWLPTSPSGGLFMNSMENIKKYPDRLLDVHGPWEHQGLEEHYRLYNAGVSLMSSEFGVEGMANRWTLERSVAEEHRLPAGKDNEIYFHCGAWWNNEPLVQETFGGGLHEIEQIRKASQFMQYEGLKYALECNLRRAMRSSGSFPWQFNEPYPNLFCTSVTDYYGFPKPAYYGVKKAYGSYLVSASFASSAMKGKDAFEADIFAGGRKPVSGKVRICAQLFDRYGTVKKQLDTWADSSDENKYGLVEKFSCGLSEIGTALFMLRLTAWAESGRIAENEYLYTGGCDFGAVFREEEPRLLAFWDSGTVTVVNQGRTAAWFVNLTQEDAAAEGHMYLSENYFTLMPGEYRAVNVTGNCGSIGIEALNYPHRIIEGTGKERICGL